jgi:hypothetical protein
MKTIALLAFILLSVARSISAEPDNERVFKSGWSASISHVGQGGGYSAFAFAVTTEALNDRLKTVLVDARTEVFLAPRAHGYDCVILSRRPLLKTEEMKIFRLVEELLSADPVELARQRANKALEPTPTSVTSPAAQEPRQP